MAEKWVSPNRKNRDAAPVPPPPPPPPAPPKKPDIVVEIKQHDGPYLCIMRSISPLDDPVKGTPGERLGRWLNERNKEGFDLLESFSLNAVDRMFVFRRR